MNPQVADVQLAQSQSLTTSLLQTYQRLRQRASSQPWWRLETGLIAGAVALGAISGVLNHWNQAALESTLRTQFTLEEVLIAATDVEPGSPISHSNIEISTTLQAGLTPNFATPAMLEKLLGRRLAIPVKRGDPILLTAVQGGGDSQRMSEKVPPGKRLFTLTIDAKAAGYGWIEPNDHVDVIAHVVLPDRGATTFTVLQDVTLVSVGEATVLEHTGEAKGQDVSFFVTPEDFETLAFAQQKGEFSLSLRNPADIGTRETRRGVDINDFLDSRHVSDASGGGELEVIEEGQRK